MTTATDLPRLNNAHLADIGTRLRSPLTDEGARAWYKTDVAALVAEVMVLRRDRAAAMAEFATHPPLEGIDQSADLTEVARQLTALWLEQQQGLWQEAEVKKLRKKLAAAEQEVARINTRHAVHAEQLTVMGNQLNALTAQSGTAANESQKEHGRLSSALAAAEAESKRIAVELEQVKEGATRAIASTRLDAQRRIDAIAEELRLSRAENQSMRDEVGQVISGTQQVYAKRADMARELLHEALRHFET